MRLFLFTVLLCNLFASIGDAQSFYAARRKDKSVILVAGTGTSTYFGELANDGDYIDAKPNINAGLLYFFNNHISARAEITWFTLKGSDAQSGNAGRIPRNLSFTSNNYEISATGALNLFSNGNRYYRRPNFNMYAFGGLVLCTTIQRQSIKVKRLPYGPCKPNWLSIAVSDSSFPMVLGSDLK